MWRFYANRSALRSNGGFGFVHFYSYNGKHRGLFFCQVLEVEGQDNFSGSSRGIYVSLKRVSIRCILSYSRLAFYGARRSMRVSHAPCLPSLNVARSLIPSTWLCFHPRNDRILKHVLTSQTNILCSRLPLACSILSCIFFFSLTWVGWVFLSLLSWAT